MNKFIIVPLITIVILISLSKILMAFPGEELNLKATDYFTQEQIELAQNYRIPKYFIFALETLLIIIFLILFSFTPLSGKLKEAAERLAGSRQWLIPPLYSFYLMVLGNVIIFPLHLYSGFIYEHQFKLSSQPLADWLKQYWLGQGLAAAVFIIGVTVFYIIIKTFPRHWWILCGTGFGIFVMISTYVLPVLILPLFNKFEPLPQGDLRNITVEISRKAGLNIEEIYVMNASRQTHKGNAFFIGMGSTKRIVLYDTLKDYPLEESSAIIAHEAGHWKHNHIIKGIGLCIIAGFCALFSLFLLLTRAGGLFNVSSPSDIKGLPLIILFFIIINLFTLPVQNSISRHFERQADMAALELTENPQACVNLEKSLAIQNLSEITPNKFLVWALYTHPPVMERIAMAEWYKTKK